MNTAANCLGQLARYVTFHLGMMESLARKCFQAVASIARKRENPNPRQLGLLQRSIIVLGAICEQASVIHGVAMSVAQSSPSNSSICNSQNWGDGAVIMDSSAYLDMEETVARGSIESVHTVVKSCFQVICGSTYTAIKYLLSPSLITDEAVKKRAAQALCSVFVGCPRLMILAQADVSFRYAFVFLFISYLLTENVVCY